MADTLTLNQSTEPRQLFTHETSNTMTANGDEPTETTNTESQSHDNSLNTSGVQLNHSTTSNEEQTSDEQTEQIHPTLVAHAARKLSHAKEQQPSSTASSYLSIPSNRKDSFRHSFIEIDHPLAQQRTTTSVGGAIDEENEETDAAQEAIIRQNAKSNDSLSSIIKQALANATVEAKSSPPPAAVAAGIAMPPSPQPQNGTNGTSNGSSNTPHPLPTTTISMTRLIKLLHHFVFAYSKNPSTFRVCPKSMHMQHRVTSLAKLDYHVSVIANVNDNTRSTPAGASTAHLSSSAAGEAAYEYCNSYPLELLIFENEKTGPFGVGESDSSSTASHTLQSRVNDSAVLKPLFRLSRFSRVHGRFILPVILVHNKNICRSSTLAIQAEAIFNNIHAAGKAMVSSFWDSISGFGGGSSNATAIAAEPAQSSSQSSVVQVGLEGQRGHDIQLLLHTATSYIEDLMVEHRKKKLGVSLTSSEKNEQWRYAQMKLNGLTNTNALRALPYPGCEFFTEYKANQHCGLNLFFNWNQSFISSDLLLSNPPPMIPDELLSCNGRIVPMNVRRIQSQIDEDDAPWFEFQHTTHDHQIEQERNQSKMTKEVLPDPNALVVTSPPSTATSSVSPPVLSSVADDLLDSLLAHSASGQDTSVMASTFPHDDTVSIGSTTSTDAASIASSIAPVHAAAPAAVPSMDADETAPVKKLSPAAPGPVTSFSLYKEWSLVTLTKNYLLVLLAHIADEAPQTGVLVHCISGWDRTPLFISLLRISLWADGEIHRSLNAMQLLYFTVAYDWMLCGHQLHNRLEKGEDVFFFCFDFLQYITNSKFSLQHAVDMRHRKRVIEEELHIERSATPTPNPTKIIEPEQPEQPRKSALTSALQQAQANGVPPLSKSSSDGSGTADGSTITRSSTWESDEDDRGVKLLVEGPSSFSPASLHAVPPASTSYTAAKPVPSLASFIIESHTGDQQASTAPLSHASSKDASTSATPAASPTEDDTKSLSPYVPTTTSTSAIPIPTRRQSKSSPHPTDSLNDTSAPSSSTPSSTTPIITARSFTDGSVIDPAAMQAAAESQHGQSGNHMSRVNSWTLIRSLPDGSSAPAGSTAVSGPTPAAPAAVPSPNELQVPGAKRSASASPRTSSSPPSSSNKTDSTSTRTSVQRCERLLAIRAAFMTAYHHILPSTPPAANSPHAKYTEYAAAMRAAARANQAISTVAPEAQPTGTPAASPQQLPAPVARQSSLPIAPPVAARVASIART